MLNVGVRLHCEGESRGLRRLRRGRVYDVSGDGPLLCVRGQ